MRAVFDLDDTICIHENRDYVNAKPVLPVIEKLREMKQAGWEIVIYSARGQISCNGDLNLIEERNRKTAEDWLERNNVPYDELIFGKPIADLYVDDRAITAKDFKSAKIGLLYGGGSGCEIYRVGDVVKKYYGEKDDVMRFRQWIKDNEGSCLFPEVISFLYNSVFMEYIDGERLVDDCKWEDIENLLLTIERFKDKRLNGFEMKLHIDNLEKNKSADEEWNDIVETAKRFMLANEREIVKRASYCHGDMILSNVLKNKNGLYLIDPRYFRESSTYLFDLAKLRMSLMDYERLFGLSVKSNKEYLCRFDERISADIKPLVIGLTLMHICRLYRYKSDTQKQVVKSFAQEVIDGNGSVFG